MGTLGTLVAGRAGHSGGGATWPGSKEEASHVRQASRDLGAAKDAQGSCPSALTKVPVPDAPSSKFR